MSGPGPADVRRDGGVFDRIAAEYDEHRPGYPDSLVDRACQVAGLEPGSAVLEIGCGTGQLTRSLLVRGLRVTAVEPGTQLARLALAKLRQAGDLDIVNARFEDAELPDGHFRAAFAASAMHWVDPDVGWRRVADALVPGATLCLLQHFGLDEPPGAEDQRRLLESIISLAPEVAPSWPSHRDLASTLEGVRERRGNVSEAWSWLTNRDVARDYAGRLFGEAEIVAQPEVVERTAAEVCALLGTMSFWSRLSPEHRAAVARAIEAQQEELGRPFRASLVACLVTAARVGAAA